MTLRTEQWPYQRGQLPTEATAEINPLLLRYKPTVVLLPASSVNLGTRPQALTRVNDARVAGDYFEFPGVDGYIDFGSAANVDPWTHTIVLVCMLDSFPNTSPIVVGYATTSTRRTIFYAATSLGDYNDIAICKADGVGSPGAVNTAFDISSITPVLGQRHQFVFKANGSTAASDGTGWLNGAKMASNIAGAAGSQSGNSVLGQAATGALTNDLDGRIYLFALFDSLLPDELCAAISADPSIVFDTRRLGVPKAAGGGPQTLTTTLAAAVQLANTLTAGMSAAVQQGNTTTAATAAAVQAAQTAQATLASAVSAAATATATLSAAVQAAPTASTTLAAAVQLARSATAALDLAVQAQGTATSAVSAQVQAASTVTASLAAQVQVGTSVSLSASAAVLASALATASADVAVQVGRTASAGMSAALAAAQTAAAVVAAAVQAARTASAGIDAQVQSGTSVSIALQAALQAAAQATASVAAAIAQAASASAALGAAVAVQRVVSAAMESAVRYGRVGVGAMSAYISDPAATFYPAAAIRTLRVRAENRLLAIPPEFRTLIIK